MSTSDETTGGNISGLTEIEAAVLGFEKYRWKYAGAKEAAIRERFDMSSTRYYQVLNALLEHPGAAAAEPLLVARLRRLREARQEERSASRLDPRGQP